LFIDSHVVQCASEGTSRKQEILTHMHRSFYNTVELHAPSGYRSGIYHGGHAS
jgi:hypothetical protein